MVQKTVAIYCRVSTSDQSCARQERDLLDYAAKADFHVVGVWKETAPGVRHNRAVREQVMALAQAREIDAILVTEMTRWGRSTLDLLQTLQSLHSWDVSLIAQSGLQFDLSTSQGRLIAKLMAALAEFERDLVSERVRSGLAAAKAKGKVLGRRPGHRVKADRFAPKVLRMVEVGYSYRYIARALQLSKTTVASIVKRHRQEHPEFPFRPARGASRESAPMPSVYQLKITLKGCRPPIWRRVQVLADTNLSQLHWVIQLAMGWTNSHLHSFAIEGIEYGVPMPELAWDGEDVLDEQTLRLDQFVTTEKFKFSYLYDFGDCWEHDILVEKVFLARPATQYPLCTKAMRACPPEDCGGVWGYQEFIEVIRDPRHPEHAETLEWVGGDFQPEEAALDEINARLRRGFNDMP